MTQSKMITAKFVALLAATFMCGITHAQPNEATQNNISLEGTFEIVFEGRVIDTVRCEKAGMFGRKLPTTVAARTFKCKNSAGETSLRGVGYNDYQKRLSMFVGNENGAGGFMPIAQVSSSEIVFGMTAEGSLTQYRMQSGSFVE